VNPPAKCSFAHDDAAYVLGALTPVERLGFERHLETCDECSRSVRALAGMPGLLDLADPRVLEDPPVDPPLPATLLPTLGRAVQARRRRRTAVVAGLAAAAAAVVALGVPTVLGRDADPAPVTTPSTGTPTTDVETLAMSPVGTVPVRADLDLESVPWGTRLLVTCTYEADWVDPALPGEVDYLLFVTSRDGTSEQVGSWSSADGTTMRVPASTSVARDDIASVEVRTTGGRVVLRVEA
jgi:hypothetical protein